MNVKITTINGQKNLYYSYKGDLATEVEDCRKELEKLEKETSYLLKRLEEENKRFTKHETRCQHLKNFIDLGEKELSKVNAVSTSDKLRPEE